MTSEETEIRWALYYLFNFYVNLIQKWKVKKIMKNFQIHFTQIPQT